MVTIANQDQNGNANNMMLSLRKNFYSKFVIFVIKLIKENHSDIFLVFLLLTQSKFLYN